MEDVRFDIEIDEISGLANIVQEKEPTLTRFEALQLAAKINMHYDREGLIMDIKQEIMEELQSEFQKITKAIYETIP